jgi:ABC-type transport system substrate-binding protein
MRVHKKEGSPLGGTFIWGIEQNFVTSFSPFTYDRYASDMIYDSLVEQGPDGEDIFWMCEDVTFLTHSDDSSIPEGHTQIFVDVVQNSTWSDGFPITAEDFAFSLNLLREYVPFQGLEEMIACYAPTTYKVFCEFETESVWNWHNIAYRSLIPKQVWADYGEYYWKKEPTPETLDELVMSGPFKPSVWICGEFEELTQNPNNFRNPRKILPEAVSETTTTASPTPDGIPMEWFAIGIGVPVIIVIALVIWRMKK